MKTINAYYANMIMGLLSYHNERTTRGMVCLESPSVPFTLTVQDPREAEVTIKARKINHIFGLIEKLSYLSGVGLYPLIITSYNKNYANFVEENFNDLGAYGPRMSRQLVRVYKQLKEDLDSRQAVVNVHNHLEDGRGDKANTPCTLSLQFLVVDGRLTLTAYMRSNDLWWGFPYDMAAFTFLQQVMATWLGLPLGHYTHVATSMHLYEDKAHLAKSVAIDYLSNGVEDDWTMPAWDLPFDETWPALRTFWEHENALRAGAFLRAATLPRVESQFLSMALDHLYDYWKRKHNKG